MESGAPLRRSGLWKQLVAPTAARCGWSKPCGSGRHGARCLSRMRSAIVKRGLTEITFLRTRDDTSTLRYSSDQEGGKAYLNSSMKSCPECFTGKRYRCQAEAWIPERSAIQSHLGDGFMSLRVCPVIWPCRSKNRHCSRNEPSAPVPDKVQ